MFDLIQWQNDVRDCTCPRTLFGMWDQVCRLKSTGKIGQYEYDECYMAVVPKLQSLERLRKSLDD